MQTDKNKLAEMKKVKSVFILFFIYRFNDIAIVAMFQFRNEKRNNFLIFSIMHKNITFLQSYIWLKYELIALE